METWHEWMQEYRKQLEKGVIQKAYKGLMDYMMALKTHVKTTYPEYAVSGSLYAGYMDMTYFAVVPPAFKPRQLKIAIVFLHEAFRFEVWLSGANKQVQAHYWKLFQDKGWNTYPLVATTKRADAIIESMVTDQPDFRDLDTLTHQIERATVTFIQEIERFLHEDHGAKEHEKSPI